MCLERRMAGKNQTLLLFLDKSATLDRDTIKVRNVQVEFLPDSASCQQPLDQRIIRNIIGALFARACRDS
jgi:hypothetical protein